MKKAAAAAVRAFMYDSGGEHKAQLAANNQVKKSSGSYAKGCNYFALFSLPVVFAIDESALKAKYFELQRLHHPDKVGLAGVQTSMELNQGYQTLMNPLARAQHFLALHDIDVGQDHSLIKPDMALLEEMMEKREMVMDLEGKEAADALLANAVSEYEQELARFTQWAEELTAATSEVEANLAQSLLRLQYITKWQAEIKQQRKRLSAV